MLILKFTDRYGRQETLEFPQFDSLSNYLKYQLRYHGFGEETGDSHWDEMTYEDLLERFGTERVGYLFPTAVEIAKQYGSVIWGYGPGVGEVWYPPHEVDEVLMQLWEHISLTWRDVEVIESP